MAFEADLIEIIAARCSTRPGVRVGIGDDAAVLTGEPTMVVAHDMLIEDVHFRRRTSPLVDIGAKSILVNLSDLAAMGARPVAATVGLGVPDRIGAGDVAAIYDGIEEVAAANDMTVAGGDISAAPALTLAVTVIGAMDPGVDPVLRSGARPGDGVYVSGRLGGAAVGLALLESGDAENDWWSEPVAALRRPRAEVALGRELAAAGAHAMMDCSDGLALDLARLAAASAAAIVLDLDAVPRHPTVDRWVTERRVAADVFAATAGEDYVLIVCMPDVSAARFPDLVRVGRVLGGADGLSITRGGAPVTVPTLGFEHGGPG